MCYKFLEIYFEGQKSIRIHKLMVHIPQQETKGVWERQRKRYTAAYYMLHTHTHQPTTQTPYKKSAHPSPSQPQI